MQNGYAFVILGEDPIAVICSLLGRGFVLWALWLKDYDIV